MPIAPCRIVEANLFTFIVNVILGSVALSFLLIKRRWFDKRRRNNRVFILDASKLLVSGTTGHFLNVILSNALDYDGQSDQCSYYLVNYLMDFLLGLPLTIYLLSVSNKEAQLRNWSSLKRRGVYPNLCVWLKQTMEFALVVCLVKILLAVPLFVFLDLFSNIGLYLVEPIAWSPHLELVAVMVLIPTFLNAVQFVVFDQILMVSEEGQSSTYVDTQSLSLLSSTHLLQGTSKAFHSYNS